MFRPRQSSFIEKQVKLRSPFLRPSQSFFVLPVAARLSPRNTPLLHVREVPTLATLTVVLFPVLPLVPPFLPYRLEVILPLSLMAFFLPLPPVCLILNRQCCYPTRPRLSLFGYFIPRIVGISPHLHPRVGGLVVWKLFFSYSQMRNRFQTRVDKGRGSVFDRTPVSH